MNPETLEKIDQIYKHTGWIIGGGTAFMIFVAIMLCSIFDKIDRL